MLWPTPIAANHRSIYASEETHSKKNHARPLQEFVGLWSTPRSSDAEKGGPNQQFGAGGIPLPAQAAQWMTPRVSETGQYQYDRGDPDKPVLTLQGQAQAMPSASSLPDRPISTVGEESSHIRRTLNPLFVEWLMGWPPGWTSLALTPPAMNASGSWGMESYLFKQRMRSALFALGLPQAAPPPQLNLFG
jgi:hypothetical protein